MASASLNNPSTQPAGYSAASRSKLFGPSRLAGWVPYILLALLNGVVSYRWNMPMTIRSVFYPLLGDHSMGLLGDLIDGLSISTTTFGVCTSLGLGVKQLAEGLQFIKNIGCSSKQLCEDAGGTWDITSYGSDNCLNPTGTLETCALEHLASPENKRESYVVIIALVTLVATLSVLSGLNNGIKTLSKVAFTLGAVAMLTVLFADNTFYILNIVVQSVGYYLQYIIQTGFDCEAFNQLNFEFAYNPSYDAGYTNRYWGSDGENSVGAKLAAAGLFGGETALGTYDCGAQFNPCTTGVLSVSLAYSLYAASLENASVAETAKGTYSVAMLKAFRMSDHSIKQATSAMGSLVGIYGSDAAMSMEGVPCGPSVNVTNTTHIDSYTASMLKMTEGEPVCEQAVAGSEAACAAFWAAPAWPRCPEATFLETGRWGMCSAYMMKCPLVRNYYGAHSNPMFMDWCDPPATQTREPSLKAALHAHMLFSPQVDDLLLGVVDHLGAFCRVLRCNHLAWPHRARGRCRRFHLPHPVVASLVLRLWRHRHQDAARGRGRPSGEARLGVCAEHVRGVLHVWRHSHHA